MEVKGRVVDHQGNAVAGADVLLLGTEQLTVYMNAGPGNSGARITPTTQPPGKSASTKTDNKGRFSLRRKNSPADRIAVVCEQMPLWERTREQLPDVNQIVISLPEPCTLTLLADIPEKPAKQEFWVVGRMLDRVDLGARLPLLPAARGAEPGASWWFNHCRPLCIRWSSSTSCRRI